MGSRVPFLEIIYHANLAVFLVFSCDKVNLAFTNKQPWNGLFLNTNKPHKTLNELYQLVFFFLSMWDIVITELLWTLSVQVSKKTTTKMQTARASNETSKKEKNKKGNNFWYIWYMLILHDGGKVCWSYNIWIISKMLAYLWEELIKKLLI